MAAGTDVKVVNRATRVHSVAIGDGSYQHQLVLGDLAALVSRANVEGLPAGSPVRCAGLHEHLGNAWRLDVTYTLVQEGPVHPLLD